MTAAGVFSQARQGRVEATIAETSEAAIQAHAD